jgi:hypothetical protein
MKSSVFRVDKIPQLFKGQFCGRKKTTQTTRQHNHQAEPQYNKCAAHHQTHKVGGLTHCDVFIIYACMHESKRVDGKVWPTLVPISLGHADLF